MAQAIGDPEELERFAYSLQQFIDSLNDAVGNLNRAFASLGDTWQDEKRAKVPLGRREVLDLWQYKFPFRNLCLFDLTTLCDSGQNAPNTD